MTRTRATFIHLALSAIVGIGLFVFLWFVLYPAPTLTAIGGHEILLLIVGVDVFIGPLLTFVVYKKGKKSLKFDLAVIVALQIGALIYGASSLWEARPAYIAALGDKFQVVQRTEVTEANLAKANATLPWFGPKLVGTTEPKDRFDIDAVRDVATMTGGGKGHFPQLHIPYEQMAAEVVAKAKSIDELKVHNPSRITEIDKWLASHSRTSANTIYQPIQIAATDYAIMLDKVSARVIGIAPFKPWP